MTICTFIAVTTIAACALLPHSAKAEDLLRTTAVERLGGGLTRLTFKDLGTGATTDDYKVETTSNLSRWTPIDNPIISTLGDGIFQATILDPGDTASRFFRVRFGDTSTESNVVAWFDLAELEVDEGSGNYSVTVRFSENYVGPLRYSWSGSATVGGLSGLVNVNGTFVQIPLNISDNSTVGDLEHLTLTLVVADDTNYRVEHSEGRAGATTIVINENDAFWKGSFQADSESVGFDLELAKTGNTHTARIISDGGGLIPEGANGEYPATSVSRTNSAFAMAVDDIGVDASDNNLLGPDATLSFSFTANDATNGESVDEALIEGTATLTITRPGAAHLNRSLSGTFILIKAPAAPSDAEVNLD